MSISHVLKFKRSISTLIYNLRANFYKILPWRAKEQTLMKNYEKRKRVLCWEDYYLPHIVLKRSDECSRTKNLKNGKAIGTIKSNDAGCRLTIDQTKAILFSLSNFQFYFSVLFGWAPISVELTHFLQK